MQIRCVNLLCRHGRGPPTAEPSHSLQVSRPSLSDSRRDSGKNLEDFTSLQVVRYLEHTDAASLRQMKAEEIDPISDIYFSLCSRFVLVAPSLLSARVS